MDPFSLSVGALTIIDACLKYGKTLVKLLEDYKSAESKVSEALLKLKVIWNKTETQMTCLQQIWDGLDSNFQNNQILLLSNLERKLQEAIRLVNGLIGANSAPEGLSHVLKKKGAIKRTKYALSVKDDLDKALSELVEWHGFFDFSWFLLSRAMTSDVDRMIKSNPEAEPIKLLNALRKSVRDLSSDTDVLPRPISSRDFLGARSPIVSSPTVLAQIDGRVQWAAVDTMVVNPTMDLAGTIGGIIALSKALSRMRPSTFGLLRCCGVINKIDKYEFVFEIPTGLALPRSLRDLLANWQPSLNVRLDVAKQLAKSVFYLHTVGFVHKNIRPETILVFDRDGTKSAFLFGFENFRAITGDTFKIGDGLPERELYRHPLRQGSNPERKYVMQHDIYSLGVCLLEIGIWNSFVRTDGDTTVIEFESPESTSDSRKRAFAIKRQLLVTVNDQLSRYMGDRFKDIVERCLTCLDDDATWSQVEEKSAFETDVGIEFIENVLLQLHEIVV